MQRLDLATGGEELVQLRHRIRALVGRTQDQRRVGFGLDAGQHADQLRQTVRFDLHAHAHRGLVVRAGQRIDQAHGAVAAPVGIGRRPPLVLPQLHGHRRIVDPRGQRVLVGLRQRQQVDERLEQRADRPLRFHRAVEAHLRHVAAADHGQYVAVVHVGHHHAGLQRRPALVLQRLDGARDRRFGIRLRRGRHAGQDRQPGALQRALGVVPRQLAAHQIHVGREAVRRGHARRLRHAQRGRQRALVFCVVDQAGLVQLEQGVVATLFRPFRVAARVVVRRPLDHADQQGDLLGGQAVEVAAEPEFRARRHAMDGLAAALAQVDLVEVGLQDGALVVARLQDQREQDLVELAGRRLLLADAEQTAAGQLLGQRAGALAGVAAGFHQQPCRAHHAGEVHAVVVLEVAVLHRLQAGDQQLGHFLQAHQAAFFLLLPVQRGDARRVQPRGLQRLLAGDIPDARHAPAGQGHLDAARRHAAVHVDVAAAGDGEAAAFARIRARTLAGTVVAVGGGIEFGLQRLRIHGQPGRQLQRARVHAGGDLPAQFAETLRDLMVQVQRVGDQEPQAQAHGHQSPAEQALPPDRSALVTVVDVVFVQRFVVVVVAGHRGCDNGNSGESSAAAEGAPGPLPLRSAGVATECR